MVAVFIVWSESHGARGGCVAARARSPQSGACRSGRLDRRRPSTFSVAIGAPVSTDPCDPNALHGRSQFESSPHARALHQSPEMLAIDSCEACCLRDVAVGRAEGRPDELRLE